MEISVTGQLDITQIAHIRALISAATAHDDLAPLSEHVLLHVTSGGDDSDEHLLAHINSELAGYLHLDQTDLVAGPSVELVVHPEYRRQGVGTALVKAATERARDARLRLWAHGELASAYQLASHLGFRKTRELWQMRRSLLAALPRAEAPAGITLRTFEPGDESDWLELNAKVFAEHPEQGRMEIDDLKVRMSESWFDPRGFLIACRDETMVGFHWVKIHGSNRSGGHGHADIGEIYVLGVSPDERGTGLGRYLAAAGLAHMREQELNAAMLYVDADNAPARALYESLGFLHWDTDVTFSPA